MSVWRPGSGRAQKRVIPRPQCDRSPPSRGKGSKPGPEWLQEGLLHRFSWAGPGPNAGPGLRQLLGRGWNSRGDNDKASCAQSESTLGPQLPRQVSQIRHGRGIGSGLWQHRLLDRSPHSRLCHPGCRFPASSAPRVPAQPSPCPLGCPAPPVPSLRPPSVWLTKCGPGPQQPELRVQRAVQTGLLLSASRHHM